MKEFTAYSIGSDGWFEYDDGPPESLDTAVFGWLNFEAADTIGVAAERQKGWNETLIFHIVNRS